MSLDSGPFARHKKPLKSEINVVPYIDVMLVLLIIFMVTTPVLTTAVKVNLPQAQAESVGVKKNDAVIVSLKADGVLSYTFNDVNTPVNEQQLINELRELKAKNANVSILINADTKNDYGSVVVLMNSIKSAGISKVGLLTASANE